MKTIFVPLFLLIATNLYAQGRWHLGSGNNTICFNHDYNYYILVDTTQTWYFTEPNKNILVFNESDIPGYGYCGKTAIITDTNNYYKKNLNSYFQIAVSWTISNDFLMRIQQKYDFQKNRDGGIIEISYDEGSTWINIIKDTTVVNSNQYGNLSGLYSINDTVYSFKNQPAFTGTHSDLDEVIIPFNLQKRNQNEGAAIIRFRIATDSIDSNNEGWMIGAINIEGWLQDAIKDHDSEQDIQIDIDLFNELRVFIKDIEIKKLDIISIDGKIELHKLNSNSINVSDLKNGIYLVRINNLFTRKIFKN